MASCGACGPGLISNLRTFDIPMDYAANVPGALNDTTTQKHDPSLPGSTVPTDDPPTHCISYTTQSVGACYSKIRVNKYPALAKSET